jgi:outer membrane lipopolysaccharide assembly protein LptE/RlpB
MSAQSARRPAALALLLAAALLAGACGYRVVGIGGQLPGGITRVEVPVFENRTTRADIGRVLTEDFISRLMGAAKLRVVGGAEAQASIQGVVTAYRREPITFDSAQKPLENRLTVVMDVSLTSREGNRLLFSEKSVTIRHDYPVRTDLQENDRLESEALGVASGLMSQKLVGLMLEGF